jgi:hypothetical protein
MRAPPDEIPNAPPHPALFGDYTLLEAGEDNILARSTEMEVVTYLLTGGFLKGYRTQVLGATAALSAVALWAVGDTTLMDLINKAPVILGGLGLTALGAKANTVAKNMAVSVK